MTAAALQPLLRALSPDGPLLAIRASGTEQQAIGLAVARVGSPGAPAEILSLYVAPPLWNQGIGGALLNSVEETLRARGRTDVVLRYTTQSPSTPALEHLLAKRGWQSPQTQLVLAQIRPAIVLEAKWGQLRDLPVGFELFAWGDISARDRAAMEKFRAEVPSALWPFDDALPPDGPSSLGLRCGGEITGWMVTHRVMPSLIRFTMLYVRERWRTSALSFTLVAEAVRRMSAAYGPQTHFTLAVQVDNLPMLRLLERKGTPWMAQRSEMRFSAKNLRA
jgi:GNAT superfamily N-acetyltransferase